MNKHINWRDVVMVLNLLLLLALLLPSQITPRAEAQAGDGVLTRRDVSIILATSGQENINLIGAWFSGVDLSNLYFKRVDLSKANLSGANLSKAFLVDVSLLGADLTNANLTETVSKRADLRFANLTGAIMSETDLTDSDLTRATMPNGETYTPGMDLSQFGAIGTPKD